MSTTTTSFLIPIQIKNPSFYSFVAQVSDFDGLNILWFSLKPESLVGETFAMFHAQFYYQTHRSKLIIVDTDNTIEVYCIFTSIHANLRFIASSRKPILKSLYWAREIHSTSSHINCTMIWLTLIIFFHFVLPGFLINFVCNPCVCHAPSIPSSLILSS